MYKFHLKSPVLEIFTVCMLIVLSYSQMMNCTGSCCVNVDGGEMIDFIYNLGWPYRVIHWDRYR